MQGLGDPDKCARVRAAVESINPCIACFQETKLAHLDSLKLASFLPGRLSTFTVKDADGSHGGIVTAWDPRLFDLLSSTPSGYSLTTVLRSVSTDLSFALTNVYAPADHSYTQALVDDLEAVAVSISRPWLALGDFNLIRSPGEKNNDRFDAARAAPLTP